MKVVLYMSMSANGHIARKDGGEDFLSHANWLTFVEMAEKAGCFVVGRKTYDTVKRLYKSGYGFDTVKAIGIVVSRGHAPRGHGGFAFVESPGEALKRAKRLGFETMILTGGATLNEAFMENGLVDEIVLNVEPFLLGSGIPVFAQGDFGVRLKHIGTKQLDGGIVQLHYAVVKNWRNQKFRSSGKP